jgi:hypothetical protein
MADLVLLDEFHVVVRVAADLPDAEVDAVRAALDGPEFEARLVRAVRSALAAFPDLAPCRVDLDR